MKAYGRELGELLDEQGGPPSRVTGGRLRGRREDRRLMHQRARRESVREIAEQLKEEEPTFLCRSCGGLLPESDRAPGTDECVYC